MESAGFVKRCQHDRERPAILRGRADITVLYFLYSWVDSLSIFYAKPNSSINLALIVDINCMRVISSLCLLSLIVYERNAIV